MGSARDRTGLGKRDRMLSNPRLDAGTDGAGLLMLKERPSTFSLLNACFMAHQGLFGR